MGNSLILKVAFGEETVNVANGIKFYKLIVKKYEIPFNGNIEIDHTAKWIIVHPTHGKMKRIPFSEGVVKGYREIKNKGTDFDFKALALQALQAGVPTIIKTVGAALI